MKSLVARIVCLSLALTVLIGSVGVAATRHICLVSGMVMPPKTEAKSDKCCKKKKEAAAAKLTFKKKCCELSVSHYKLETKTGNTFESVKLPVLFMVPAFSFIPDWVHAFNPQKLFVASFNKAPPLAGRALLTFIHILRI